MDSFIVLFVEQYGWLAILGGLVVYLLAEGFLDIATDLISYKIIKKMDKEPD